MSSSLTKLINYLDTNSLDTVSKLYLNEVLGVENYINVKKEKIDNALPLEFQYQIITKNEFSLETVYEYLSLASNNVEKKGFPSKLLIFYSCVLKDSEKARLQKIAKTDYHLVLENIDAYNLSTMSDEFTSIKDCIEDNASKTTDKIDFFDDKQYKTFYDLMSFGTSSDIKSDIIKAYILNFLCLNGKSSEDNLLKDINNHFNAQIDKAYFQSFLGRLKKENIIKTFETSEVELKEEEKERIDKILNDYQIEETLLRHNLYDILKDYPSLINQEETIIIKLSKIYESNYSVNLKEFIERESDISNLNSATNELREFIESYIPSDQNSTNLVKNLIEAASESQILSRIAAGEVFSKITNPEKLQEYLNHHQNNNNIFIDANVLIYLICAQYDPNITFRSNLYFFYVAKQFLDFVNRNNLQLKTIRRYAIETTNIFKEALALVPFTQLSHFNQLGESSNVLYRFYSYLQEWDLLDAEINTFEKFLLEFKFDYKTFNKKDDYRSQMEYLLEDALDLEIEEINKDYDLSHAKEIISNTSPNKNNFAVKNDAILFNRMGDRDKYLNPIEPIFCTWDKSLIKARKEFFKSFPNCTRWFVYTPTRLMDHFSMMNLQVQQGTLSNEVLSILDTDSDFQEKTSSLIDSIVQIINPKSTTGLKYTNELARLREEEIAKVNEINQDFSETRASTSSNAVDLVLQSLYENYQARSDESFNDLKQVFEKDDFYEEIIGILSQEIQHVKHAGNISPSLFTKMDEMIARLKN